MDPRASSTAAGTKTTTAPPHAGAPTLCAARRAPPRKGISTRRATGAPTLFAVRRAAAGTGIDSLRITGSLDHVKAKPRDVLTVQAGGVALPTFPIPGLPYRGDPGRGASELRLTLDGDQLAAHWTLSTPKLAWIADSAAKKLNAIESLVARVLTGVASLQMNADVAGTLQAPKLAVSSNLDRVVADQLKSVAGEQVAAA